MTNPWLLQPHHEQILTLLAECGTDKAIARRLNLSIYAVRGRIEKARERMGVDNRVVAAVQWDRYVRQQEHA